MAKFYLTLAWSIDSVLLKVGNEFETWQKLNLLNNVLQK